MWTKEEKNAYTRDYMKKYRQTVKGKQKQRIHCRDYNAAIRRESLMILGGKCSVCGFEDFRALQIDHINGDGHNERKIKQSVQIQRWIVQNPLIAKEKYQVLCANHNWIKRYENKEHRKRIDDV